MERGEYDDKSILCYCFYTVASILSGCGIFQNANDWESDTADNQTEAPVISSTVAGEIENSDQVHSLEYFEAGIDDRILYRQFYEYDDQGRLSRLWSPEGYLTRVSDAHHLWLLLDVEEITAVVEHYDYDQDGRLFCITGISPEEEEKDDNIAYQIKLIYDSAGRVIEENMKYHLGDIKATLNYSDGVLENVHSIFSGAEYQLDYEYNEQGRIRDIILWKYSSGMADRLAYYLYQYDDETGLLWRVSKSGESDDWDSWENYEYNDDGSLFQITREWKESMKRPSQTWLFS